MTERDQTSATIRRARRAASAALWFERLWPAAYGLALVGLAFAALSWFGLFRHVPDWARIATGIAFGALALWPLSRLLRVRPPRRDEIDRRIERTNALAHQPLAVQDDALAADADPFAAALWAEHKARMAARVGRLGDVLPAPRIAARDPYGLRALVVLVALTGLAFSFGPAGGRLGDILSTREALNRVPPRIDAWVTPPGYTGKAPIVLTAGTGPETVTTVPQGSTLLVRVTGGTGGETFGYIAAGDDLVLDVLPDETARSDSRAFTLVLADDGRATLDQGGETLFSHVFAVTPDNPPEIAFIEPQDEAIVRSANGAFDIRHDMRDDYGIRDAFGLVSLAVPMTGDERPLYDAPEVRLTLPPRGETASATTLNLTDHPWAGLEVDIVLQVTDAAGQMGESAPLRTILPGRSFTNPLARAIAYERRVLALDANKADSVREMLDTITLHAETFIPNTGHFLAIRSAMARLDMARSDEQLRDVADYLWDIALNIENGGLTDAERRLREAQQALRDALQNGASEEEISRLVDELRQAMNDFLREFAERALAEGMTPQEGQQQDQQNLDMADLDEMLNRMEELANQGARDQAEQLLSQLENMLNNLQMGQQNQAGQQGQGEMQRQLNELGEILRRQQELMDETMRADRDGQNGEQQDGQQGQQGEQGQQGQQGQQGGGNREQALRGLQQGQGELQQRLQELMDGLGQLGMEPSDEFAEGEGAMGRAGEALGEGEGEMALSEQGQALDALRRGAEGLMQQLQQMQNADGEQGGGEPNGQARGRDDRDPLGRPRSTTGPDFGDSVKVPDEIDIQRAREILEEIRRRLGDALSPEQEKQYLERLLDFDRNR